MAKRRENEPPVRKLSEFEPGEQGDCFAMLAKKEAGKTRDGKPFYRDHVAGVNGCYVLTPTL